MINPWDEKLVDDLIRSLRQVGVGFTNGLSESQLASIEADLGATLPVELRLLLARQVPVSLMGDRKQFPQWNERAKLEIVENRRNIDELFAYDIKHNGYWSPLFGDKPVDEERAIHQALARIRTWPPLVRFFGHRYIPTDPVGAGNPVLSVWQPTDSVYYGKDFVDYLVNEFGIERPEQCGQVPASPASVPYWGKVFGLE